MLRQESTMTLPSFHKLFSRSFNLRINMCYGKITWEILPVLPGELLDVGSNLYDKANYQVELSCNSAYVGKRGL